MRERERERERERKSEEESIENEREREGGYKNIVRQKYKKTGRKRGKK